MKYSGINEINKAAFDAIVPRTKEAIEQHELPVDAKYETSNIEAIGDDILNALKVGDTVAKITGNMRHTYIVTYKEEQHGICLSYNACGYMETISYDYTDGHWVFNSKDVCNITEELGKVWFKMIPISVNKTLEHTDSGYDKIVFNNIPNQLLTSDTMFLGLTMLNSFCLFLPVNNSLSLINLPKDDEGSTVVNRARCEIATGASLSSVTIKLSQETTFTTMPKGTLVKIVQHI